MNRYFTNKNIKPLPKYFDFFFNKFSIKKYKILDVGMGNGLNYSINLSKLKNTEYYYGLEPNDKLNEIAHFNCKRYECNINIVKNKLENFNSKKKFNIILFINSFHFSKNYQESIDSALKLLNRNGIILIKEPLIKPYGWASDLLNIESENFRQDYWEKKKYKLEETQNYLRNLKNTKLFEFKKGNIYIVLKK